MQVKPSETKAKILIAAETCPLAGELEDLLAGLGYAICGRTEAVEGIPPLIRESRPDMIVMSMHLYEKLAGTRAVDDLFNKSGVPVIPVISYVDIDRLENVGLVYPFGYILKPFQDRVVGMTINMTLNMSQMEAQRRQTEKQLRLSNTFLDAVIEQSPYAMWISDDQGTLIHINRACRELLSIAYEEVVGRYNIFKDEAVIAQGLIPKVKQVYEEGRQVQFFIDWFSGDIDHVGLRNKVRVQLEVTVSPIRDEEGRVTNAIIQHVDVTRQHMIEEALRESEARLIQAQHIAHIGNWEWDLTSNDVYWSDELYLIHGYQPKEMTPTYDFVVKSLHPDSRDAFQEVVRAAVEENAPFSFDYKVYRKDGSIGVLQVIGRVVPGKDGRAGKLEGIAQDITERKRDEEALRESEERFRTLVENIPQKIFIKDVAGKYKSCNPSYAADLGISPEEIKGHTDFDFFPAHLAEKYTGDDRRIMDSGRLEQFIEIYEKGGERFWVNTVKTPVKGDDGRVNGILGVFWDITDQKVAEEAVRESEARFRQLFDNIADVVIIHRGVDEGRDFVFVDVNPRGEQLMGVRRDEVVGRSVAELYPIVREIGLLDVFTQVYRTGEPRHYPVTMQTKAGGELSFDNYVIPLPADMIAVLYSDTTEKRKAEQEKEKLQAQLLQAQKMEAVGVLAGGIAHDFNNLIQAISGYIQLLVMDFENDPKARSKLKAIEAASQRASGLVQQLLVFSRKSEPRREPVTLNKVIEQSLHILERAIPKMVEIVFRPGDRLGTVHADPVQIEQILLNLGTNAADAMPDGGKLVIETEDVVYGDKVPLNRVHIHPGRYALLTVSDTGQGMDQQTVDKIFEPFFTTKPFGRGTGLGLASVYGIVKNHGGLINCYSEIGRGTTFKIYLPAGEQEATAESDAAAKAPPARGTETILLVDDEEVVRTFAAEALQRFGYSTITAASGEEALEIYGREAQSIDLVIMDIGMPGMGGHKCLKEIIKMDPDARVLISSGYSVDSQFQKTMDAGASGYVGKPYRLDKLLGKIREVLDGGGS